MSKITKASRGSVCIRCSAPDAYSCHYNGKRQMALGKGRGIKCHDLATAEFCHACDARFTEGSIHVDWETKWERSEEFLYYILQTNIRRLKEGVIHD